MGDKIKEAYKSSKNIYDAVLMQESFFSKIYTKLFWNGVNNIEIANKVLSFIPDDFCGSLLDVPVGTALFTYKKYKILKNAQINCLDYSIDMLELAKKRMEDLKISNVEMIQGDVGALPLEAESQDIVLSMNGFHAFPNKEKAFEETYRVLKRGGIFIGGFYIKDESRATDWLIKNVLSKKGWFTPPYYSKHELEKILKNLYTNLEINNKSAIVYFKCVKA